MKNLFFTLLALIALSTFAQAQYNRVERYASGARNIEVSGSGNDSIMTMWFENGNRSTEGRYMYGKMIGAWQYFHESGKTSMLMYFDSLNVRTYKDD